MAKLKSVLIWGGDDLLSAAFDSCLMGRPDFQVTINPGHGGFAAGLRVPAGSDFNKIHG